MFDWKCKQRQKKTSRMGKVEKKKKTLGVNDYIIKCPN